EREVAVPVRFVVGPDGNVSLALGAYDPTQPLTIDPSIVYSTYLGGSGEDGGTSSAVDSAGNAYVSGFFGSNAFVDKLNPTGSAVLYSTILGGNANSAGYGIAVDASGNAYVTGQTYATNFPTTNPSGYQLACDRVVGPPCNGDAFVTKLNASGGLAYSSYLGGGNSDAGYGIAVDASGSAYVTGQTNSTNFPAASSLQNCDRGGGSSCLSDAFAATINPNA